MPRTRSLAELMSLRGRVAVVTGGAGHIGAVIAEALAEAGARVVILDREESACERTRVDINDRFPGSCTIAVADLENEPGVVGAARRLLADLGSVDVLVNCAALVGTSDLAGWAVPFGMQSPATWRRALEVNLTAPFVLTQQLAPALAACGRGSVINISSIYGLVGPDLRLYEGTPLGNPGAYAASKGGLIQLTRWLATTLAPQVRVNAISLGGILRGQSEVFRARYETRTPLQRMGVEEDAKGAAVYLASDLSSYVTGQNLVVDGGWTAW